MSSIRLSMRGGGIGVVRHDYLAVLEVMHELFVGKLGAVEAWVGGVAPVWSGGWRRTVRHRNPSLWDVAGRQGPVALDFRALRAPTRVRADSSARRVRYLESHRP